MLLSLGVCQLAKNVLIENVESSIMDAILWRSFCRFSLEWTYSPLDWDEGYIASLDAVVRFVILILNRNQLYFLAVYL